MFRPQYMALNLALANLSTDIDKADKGNHAAKTRIRVALQQVKKDAQVLRVALLQPAAPTV